MDLDDHVFYRSSHSLIVTDRPTIGSAIMRGQQLGKAMNIDVKPFRWGSTTIQQTLDMIIVVKIVLEDKILKALKTQCEILVYDTVDTIATDGMKKIVGCMNRFDIITTTTEACRLLLYQEGYEGQSIVLPHHWDPRLDRSIGEEEEVKEEEEEEEEEADLVYGYMGCAKKLYENLLHSDKLLDTFDNFRVFDTECGEEVTDVLRQKKSLDHLVHRLDNMDRLKDKIPFNCHLSIRPEDTSVYKYKTNAKVSTAAALGHLIYTTKEQAAVEVLGFSYPLYFENDTWDCVDTKLKLRPSKAELTQAKSILEKVREDTSIENIARRYKCDLDICIAVIRYIKVMKKIVEQLPRSDEDTRPKCLIYRCMFGAKEEITIPTSEGGQREQQEGYDCYYIAVTDKLDHPIPYPYKPIYAPLIELPSHYQFPVRTSKATVAGTVTNRIWKILLPALLDEKKWQTSIYGDWAKPLDMDHALDILSKEDSPDLNLWTHPDRKRPIDEIQVLVDVKLITREKARYYQNLYKYMCPEWLRSRATENCVLVRKHTELCKRSMRAWFQCFLFHIQRDQASLQFVLSYFRYNNTQCVPYSQLLLPASCVYPMETIYWDVGQDFRVRQFLPRSRNVQDYKVHDSDQLPPGLELDTETGELKGFPEPIIGRYKTRIVAKNATSAVVIPLEFVFTEGDHPLETDKNRGIDDLRSQHKIWKYLAISSFACIVVLCTIVIKMLWL
jgi:hypothetical protein